MRAFVPQDKSRAMVSALCHATRDGTTPIVLARTPAVAA